MTKKDNPSTEISSLAVTSMVCGILGFFTIGITGVAAVITGHIARRSIKKSDGKLVGGGFAVMGLITGYLSVLFMLFALLGIAKSNAMLTSPRGNEVEIMTNARNLGKSMLYFDSEYGDFPNDSLAKLLAERSGTQLSLTGPNVLNQLDLVGGNVGLWLTVGPATHGDWTYFPKSFVDTSFGYHSSRDPRRVILLSPDVNDRAVVLHIDQSVRVVSKIQADDLRKEETGITIPAIRR